MRTTTSQPAEGAGRLPGIVAEELQAAVAARSGDASAALPQVSSGKVRDLVDLGDRLLIVTTDRVSAFDRVLTTIPLKGQVLNQISLFWFRATEHLVANHLLAEVTPRSMLVRRARVVPVEVVVRGYLTGSAYRDYRRDGAVCGIQLPAGMRFNQRFERPLLTPQAKAAEGQHDRSISRDEVLAGGQVDEPLWQQIERAAHALYRFGVAHAAARGLILVDTKYEFGTIDGELVLADEVHTPDSSRYWFADTYEERFARGEKQRKLDKEFLRQWLMDRDYMGDGAPPEIPAQVRDELGARYRQLYSLITGAELIPSTLDHQQELAAYAEAIVG